VTPVFPRDVDLPAKKTPPEISTTRTNGYLVQMRASVGVASVLDPREYRRPKKKEIERDANSFFFHASLPNPLGNVHRLRVTVFSSRGEREKIEAKKKERKRKREKRWEERGGAGWKEGLEEEEPPSNKFEYRCLLNPIEGVRQKSSFTLRKGCNLNILARGN